MRAGASIYERNIQYPQLLMKQKLKSCPGSIHLRQNDYLQENRYQQMLVGRWGKESLFKGD